MKQNLQDEVYRIVGEEVLRNEYQPGPMARAVDEGSGNRDLIQSLYVRFRREEIVKTMEREAVASREARERETKEALRRKKENIFDCACGFRGKATVRKRGNMAVALVGLCVFIVPGLLYGLAMAGYEA